MRLLHRLSRGTCGERHPFMSDYRCGKSGEHALHADRKHPASTWLTPAP